MKTWTWTGLTALGSCGALFALAACSASGMSPGDFVDNGAGGGTGGSIISGGAGGGGGAGCTSATECPAGYTCEAGRCVAPEQETNRGLDGSPPVATPHYVYALNPTAASVARIDPVSLAIEAVPVGPQPVALSAMPGEDAALALSYADASLSLIDSRTLPSRVTRIALRRQYSKLTVSGDGAWAVAWPEPSTAPTSGAEGVFALVDLVRARAGAPVSQVVLERAGGYRITTVVFRTDADIATRLHVFAKASVSTFDLTVPATQLPARLTLPASMSADVASREITSTRDGHVVMLRSTVAPELASFDGAALTVAPISEVATDLDLLPDGTAAVAALRTAGELAYIRIPQDLAQPSNIARFPVDGGVVGQVALPPVVPSSGMFALVYSNAEGDESFSRVDLPSGAVTRYPLEKLVDEIGLSPDAKSAIILHKANPGTTATDLYEAAVDRDQGYSVFDVGTGFWQLERTGVIRPTRYAFSPQGGYVGVALRDDGHQRFSLDAVNLGTLVSTSLSLASAPLFMGTVPEAPGITPHRVFVSQNHPAGRISVIQLDSGQVRTATGFTLNGEIQ